MLSLSDILKPRSVDLALGTAEVEAGIEKLAHLLAEDPGMLNWTAFHHELKHAGTPVGDGSILAHLRTDHVSTMMMAAGRLPPIPGDGPGFLFLIVVPKTLASEYLRMVGALARSLRNPVLLENLRDTASKEEFVEILCSEAAAL